jgi:regulator of cell morphogenesis and NO signaling
MSIDPSRSLSELVLDRPSSMRIFARLGLDYCCGGRQSLADACAERGLDATTVAVFLEREPEPVVGESRDWGGGPLEELCAHIVEEHHARMRWELPRLTELADRAASVHGDRHPELVELRALLAELRGDLEEHMADEEERLFPALVRGDVPETDELARLQREHETVGAQLRRLRELSGGYAGGDAYCNTHRALLEGLHGLELDLHQHVHEENNVLFPRVLGAA